MRDLIDRQTAIDLILKDKIDDKSLEIFSALGDGNQAITLNIACDRHIQGINELPSAQPEIIRCKNCTWWSNDEYRECSSPNYDNVHVTPAGFYCGWAKRRTDENND